MQVPHLSPIEERVILLVTRGVSPRAIGEELGVGVRTVEWHLARARRKLGWTATLHDRVEQATERAETQGGTQ